MRVGFYLSGNHPVERVLPLIAREAGKHDQRMLVVAEDEQLLDRIDRGLWEVLPEAFLAHGRAGQPYEQRHPVLLSGECGPAANGAKLLAIADARWREEAESFERVLLFFENDSRQAARDIWRQFDSRDDVDREFFELEDGKWTKKA